MKLSRNFTGLPAAAQRSLNELCDYLESLWNITADESVDLLLSKGGSSIGLPDDGKILAQITGGNNPYSWVQQQADGSGTWSNIQPSELQGTLSPLYRPAYEANGNANVPVGSIVWLYPDYLDITSSPTEDLQYRFWWTGTSITLNNLTVTNITVNGTGNYSQAVLILPTVIPVSYRTGTVYVTNNTCTMYYQCGPNNTTKMVPALNNGLVPVSGPFPIVTNVACVNNTIVMTQQTFTYNNGILTSVV